MRKGQLQRKTYGGTSWLPGQSKIEKAQIIKGFLNVFGVYDDTNDQMYTHSYRKKTGKQFLDFIKRDRLKIQFLYLNKYFNTR